MSDVEVCLYVAGLGLIAGELSPFPPTVPTIVATTHTCPFPKTHAARTE